PISFAGKAMGAKMQAEIANPPISVWQSLLAISQFGMQRIGHAARWIHCKGTYTTKTTRTLDDPLATS
ncbi:MAG TPA: hypothetical protein VHR66_04780, partial [Gemmataceae bacterium]|nr:hypothetical protein [Gemmataceae bacterium]